jgi:hypothetical protein
MVKRTIPGLFVRLLILTGLVSALLFTSVDVTRKTVHANTCPDDCEADYQACIASCPPWGQPGYAGCARYCRYELDECLHCLP